MRTRNSWPLGFAALLFLMPVALQTSPVSGAPTLNIQGQDAEELVQHIISPQATDPEIDTFLDSHYIWVNPAKHRDDSMLWVFLPPTGRTPREFQLIESEAARLGYHVISLMYPNLPAVVAACNPLPDPNERESCYENIRLQTVDGITRSGFTKVNPPNSIYNRLTKLLRYLAANFPQEGWKHFLKSDGPRWSRIAIVGHSQGGGNAAVIAKLHRVARVVMISSPVDGCALDPAAARCAGSGNLDQAARWVAIGATPANRYYGLAHQREPSLRPTRANWKALGLEAFGPPVAPETSAPPYSCTHILLTDLLPATGSYGLHGFPDSHSSTALDVTTPRLADGTPALRDAWRYISAKTHDDSCENGAERKLHEW